MYAILGATGKLGGRVAELLLKAGLPVRVVMRDSAKSGMWLRKGAEVAIANLFDPGALTKAFIDATAVFILIPPLFNSIDPLSDHDEMLNAIIKAIKSAGLEKVVYRSSIGAQHPGGTGIVRQAYDLEKAFLKLELPTAGIRPAWLMENFIESFTDIRNRGIFRSLLKPVDEKMPMVSVADISKLATQLLQESWTGHRIVELEGPRRYAVADVTSTFSHWLEHQVGTEDINDADYEQIYRSSGYTPLAAYLMAEMIRAYNNQEISFERKDYEQRKGEVSLEDAIIYALSESLQD